MAETLRFACRCGTLRGEVTDVSPAAYTNIVCHCTDCRSAYTHLGIADPEKVGILQTTQDRIRITQGGEKLRLFRLSARGALRWYATCCDTPLFYTPTKARAVHVGLNADRLEHPDALGPVTAEAFIPAGPGKTKNRGLGRMVGRMVTRMAAKNLNGEWRDTPFFDADGAPARPPQVLSREERAAALMKVSR
ncbi:DUF6151 family protein [Jannaschia seohaensis]|uniref:Uncharacterized conserved protein n=1 Tax=Jannaschia seohaensis TaxID=475081 RepID=A0A2Y9AQT3_9RHOB|nr:DUF6151 family protein [Jannaschia seohaensis]PWJ18275.1 hypothetical protein BCF38_105263 [Jannaschia seohaensis]SSA46800.1 Uncharacterized conserved protein [Jannaschia seohaensis]